MTSNYDLLGQFHNYQRHPLLDNQDLVCLLSCSWFPNSIHRDYFFDMDRIISAFLCEAGNRGYLSPCVVFAPSGDNDLTWVRL